MIALGIGLGLSFTGGSAAGPLMPSDGYYYQADLSDPRTLTGWTSGANLHDGSSGDTSTGYATTASGTNRVMAVAVYKATGITHDNALISAGYRGNGAMGVAYGTNDGVTWTAISYSSPPALTPNVSFTYNNANWANGGSAFPSYKLIVFTITATGNQAGCADVRLRSSTTDVGP